MDIITLQEEFEGLIAYIEATPDLPFAHLAPRQAALARVAIETEMVRRDLGQMHDDVTQMFSLKILSKIAQTTMLATLDSAITSGDVCLAWLIMENGANVTDEIFSTACLHGHTEIVRLLVDLPLERGVNPAARDNEALLKACKHGHTEIVRLLVDLPLERGVNPAARDNEALRHACDKFNPFIVRSNPFIVRSNTDIVRLLLDLPLERGINPGARDDESLLLACINGETEIVRLLLELPLERGVNPAARDNGPFQLAYSRGYTKIVRMLLDLPLERGVNPDETALGLRLIHCIPY